ncbi:MAG: L-lactate permease [Erysipelotrichaceae bacterium]
MLENSLLMFLLALLPIIWLIVALSVLKLPAHIASVFALFIAIIEAVFFWNLPFISALTASLEGFVMALWPIIIVIIAAVFTYNLTVYTKNMDIIKKLFTSVNSDARVLVILIGWCFGGFLEAIAGFGVAIAIPSSMLYALGFNPITAILACLVANGCPTMFGSIGIPTTTLASITSLNPNSLAFIQTLQVALLLFISPYIMVMITGKGFKALKGVMGFVTVASLSFVIPEILAAKFVSPELTIIIASIVSLICTFMYAKKMNIKDTTYLMEIAHDDQELSFKKIITAFSPFLLIFVLLLLTSKLVPFINGPLSSIKSTFIIYQGVNPNPYTITWINTPGVLIMISGIIGGFIQKCSFKEQMGVLKDTIIQMSKTMITMLSVLGCAKVMGYSHMVTTISSFLILVTGTYYPLVSPVIGAIGTFVTGSGTSSQVLFGNIQLQAANALNINEYWLVAANSLGTSAGKMLSPQSIAIGCAACGLVGKDGEILKKIFKFAILYLVLMAFIIYFGYNIFMIFA